MLKLTGTGSKIEVYRSAARRRAADCPRSRLRRQEAPRSFGIDIVALPGVDLVHDLEAVPYPVLESCAEEIHLNHVLEHLENPLTILAEAWRLARHGGHVFIRTPHYSGVYSRRDPTRRRAFSAESFHYFGENDYSYYTHARFHVVNVGLKYFVREELWPWPHRAWARAVQWCFDRHPTFGERFLCYLVGDINELRITLAAVKPP